MLLYLGFTNFPNSTQANLNNNKEAQIKSQSALPNIIGNQEIGQNIFFCFGKGIYYPWAKKW